MDKIQLPQGRRTLLVTIKSPGVTNTHHIDHQKMSQPWGHPHFNFG